MDEQLSGEPARQTAAMLKLSLRLRDAAVEADRPDVVAKVDELLSLIAGERIAAAVGSPRTGSGVAEAVQRILNGLGF